MNALKSTVWQIRWENDKSHLSFGTGDAMRREMVLPSPHGHQAPQIKPSWLVGSVVKSSWPDRRPPKLSLHILTISGASRMFELSHTLLKSRSNIERNSSLLSAENSARKASKRWSHFHDKTSHEALNLSLEIFSRSYFIRCMTVFLFKKHHFSNHVFLIKTSFIRN